MKILCWVRQRPAQGHVTALDHGCPEVGSLLLCLFSSSLCCGQNQALLSSVFFPDRVLCLENVGEDVLTAVKEAIVGFILARSHWFLLIVSRGERTPALPPVNARCWARETPAKLSTVAPWFLSCLAPIAETQNADLLNGGTIFP